MHSARLLANAVFLHWYEVFQGRNNVSWVSLAKKSKTNPAKQDFDCVLLLQMTGMLFASGTSLVYTAMVVPVQIFLWDNSEPCNMFPTLYFDLVVDTFFLVS